MQRHALVHLNLNHVTEVLLSGEQLAPVVAVVQVGVDSSAASIPPTVLHEALGRRALQNDVDGTASSLSGLLKVTGIPLT